MNKLIPVLCITIITLASCKKSKFDSDYETLKFDGEKRSYLLHIPDSYNETPTALVIALHGGTGSAKNIEEQSQLPNLSDEKGFILCSPNGLHKTWNAGNCCGKAETKNVDDVGFISKLIDEISDNYNIDEKRIYVTGMSNGAMMSYRLACELSDKIAAIAPVAGTMVYNQCAPLNGVSIIHFHSKKDSNVPYKGGVGAGISDHYNPPIDSVLNFWNNQDGCSDSTFQAFDQYSVTSWTNCITGAEVTYYLTEDGGHSWPMGTQPRNRADEPSQAVNANELMWEFFSQHSKP